MKILAILCSFGLGFCVALLEESMVNKEDPVQLVIRSSDNVKKGLLGFYLSPQDDGSEPMDH